MMNLLSIPKLQDQEAAWQKNKIRFLNRAGTTFVDHFDNTLYERVVEAKKRKEGSNEDGR